jgi:hypothetical protein
MPEHVPTREEIETAYAGGWSEDSIPGKNAREEFAAWLADHDAQVLDIARRPRMIAAEREANAADEKTVIRDVNGDVFEKVSGRGWEMTGESGRWGPTWIKYPATVLWAPLYGRMEVAPVDLQQHPTQPRPEGYQGSPA